MVKLWIKIVKNDKTIKEVIVERDEKFDYASFADYITEGLYSLDEAPPVIIKNHIFNFAKYNAVRFLPSDFVESVSFDFVWVENLNQE